MPSAQWLGQRLGTVREACVPHSPLHFPSLGMELRGHARDVEGTHGPPCRSPCLRSSAGVRSYPVRWAPDPTPQGSVSAPLVRPVCVHLARPLPCITLTIITLTVITRMNSYPGLPRHQLLCQPSTWPYVIQTSQLSSTGTADTPGWGNGGTEK